ncbi:MAG: winged helix-turn-helix domain-containing protein [Actinomycetota bacterium]
MAAYLLLTDGSAETALPASRTAGADIKVEPLSLPPSRIVEVAPLAVLVDATADPGAAFSLLSDLRTRDPGLQSAVIAADPEIQRYPWHEVTDELIRPEATESELRLRLSLLRRRGGGGDEGDVRLGSLTLNTQTYRVAVDGRPMDLTYKEFELLRFLASRPGRVFTRESLLREVWGYDFYGGARTVDVHVRRLRAKLGPEHEHLIETVRGVGYRASDLLV